MRPPAGGQLARGPLLQLDNRFPPAPANGPQHVRQSTRRTQGVGRNRRASWGGLPGNNYAAQGPSSSTSSAGLVNGRDSHATQSVCYVSDGQQRQVELKVPLLQIPKLCQLPPDAKESSDKMAVSEPPGQGSNKSDAVPSKPENAPKAAEKPKAPKASMVAEASSEGMAALSSKAPKANSSNAVASEDEHAVLKKTNVHAVVVPKPVSVKESQTSAFKCPQANDKAVSKPPSLVSNAEENPSSAVARRTDHAATKSQKLGASPVASSKPIPESKSSESPSQVSSAKVNPPSAVDKKTDHAATKPKKLGTSSVLNSKLVPESGTSKLASSHADEETAVMRPPDHTSKAKASLSNLAARETDLGASAKPNVPSVTDPKPIPVKVLPAQGKPVPPQASNMVLPNQAPKAKTVRAPTASTKHKASSVAASKPTPVRVSQAGEPTLPQVSSVPDSKLIPVRVSQGSVPTHPASLTRRKPVSSQKKHSPGDEFYEDVSDVSLEEYCDDPSNEASQVEGGVVFGAGREGPQQPSSNTERATQLSDVEDVSDTPLTMYHSPEKSGNPVQPGRQHAGEGVAKRPLGKKKVVGHMAAVKKTEEQKCAKAVEAGHSLHRAAAKPKLVTNKVKAHLAMKQGAAKLTATAAPPDGKPGGAAKRQLEWPGSAHQDVKRRKVDTSFEKSKPDSCASSTRQNGTPSPGKKLAVKKITKVVSCTKVSTMSSVAGSNNKTSEDSPVVVPSTTQQNGSLLAAKKEVSCSEVSSKPSMTSLNNKETSKDSPVVAPSTSQQNGSSLAAKKIEKEASCSEVSTKPSMTSFNNKETSKDSPKLEASKEVVPQNKKSEPTSAKTDTGHSSVMPPTHKKDSAKRKSTPLKKALFAKSGKSTLPGKAAAMKLSKSPPSCTATKATGKTNCLAPKGLPITEGSPNPQAQTEAAPAAKQPQPPSSRATVKVHTPSSEETSTKARESSSSSAVPAKHQDMPKAPEALLGKDDPTQKDRCSGSTGAALVRASTSDVCPESGLKQCHAPKTKELSSEATKTHKSFSGPAPTPRKREVEADGTLCVVADGQPRDNTSQKPTGSAKEQKTTPVEKRCLDDTSQASGIQKKTEAATMVKAASGIEGDTKNSGAAEKIEDRRDRPPTNNVASERSRSAGELPTSGSAVKTKHPVSRTIDKAAKTATGKEVLSKLTSGDATKAKHPASKAVKATTGDEVTSKLTSAGAVKTKHPSSGAVERTAEATKDKDALSKPTSDNAVKTKRPASGIVVKAAECTTDKGVLGSPSNDVTCSSFSHEPESVSVPLPTDKNATAPPEENMVEDQAEGLAGSKTAAASPHDGEGFKQVQEPSMVSSPSCDVAEADHISGMLPQGSNCQKSPADDATLVNRGCESLATSRVTSTLISPSQERACDMLSLTKKSDDSSASIIGQVSSSEQPRRKSPVPPELPASARTMKQGDGNESPSACDVSTQEPVKSTDLSQKPRPGEGGDKGHESTTSTVESDGQTGEESSLSPPQQREGDCPMTISSNSGERDACATLSQGDAGACKPDADVGGPATSIHQEKVIKPSPLKKKNKNKGPGTNTSMRSSWLFSRKKRGKRRRRSTETPSGSSPKKLKAADSSQGSSSEHSVSPAAVKKEPADDVDTEATLPSAAPPGHCSGKKPASRTGQARRSRDPKCLGNSAKKFKADMDRAAQDSSTEFTGGPSTSLVKKEPGGDSDIGAQQLLNAPGTLRILRGLASPAVQGFDRSPEPAGSAKSPAASRKPSDPSSSSNTASAAMPASPLEMALMDLDMFTGLSILDVCGSGAAKLAELKEQLQVHSITKEEALDVVQNAVHKAVLDEYFKREHAIRTLKLLAKIPFSLDHTKAAKVQQFTQAIVATSQAGGKP